MNAYQVTLINLLANAGSTGAESRVDRSRMSAEELRELLVNFCGIDAVEHATLEPEIRVQVRGESYVLRAGHKNLVLYDALHREAPGHVVTVDEAMAELDGSAQAARTAVPWHKLEAAHTVLPVVAMAPSPRSVRVWRISLAAAVIVFAAGAGFLRFWPEIALPEAGWTALAAAEATAVRNAVAGVYLAGSEPGAHGLVVMPTGELRLFEFRGGEVPRVVRAAYEPAHAGSTLVLVTDQPGGAVIARDANTLLYSGETFVRVP